MRKVLWIVDGDQNKFLERAKYVRAEAVCIRTTNAWLKGSVQDIKKQGLDVYAWRWPSVDPNSNARHHYVEDEIDFVEGLIAEGLDGYIVDPESDDGRDSDDWNDAKWAGLADHFCDAIKSAGRKKNPDFLFGTTSGCDYPVVKAKIPWSTFLAYSDAVYPQIYWAPDYITAKRTTPDAAWKIGMAAWKKIVPASMPVHPILGEIGTNTPDEIARFGQIMIDNKNTDEVHFYTYEDQLVAPAWSDTWDALRSFGTAVAGLGAPKAPASAKLANQKKEKMPTGLGMLQRARQHIHEDYVLGVVAPKNNPNWRGPWDCAEFTSWLVYQEARVLYGCVDDNSLPAVADAYTGAWTDEFEPARDAHPGRGSSRHRWRNSASVSAGVGGNWPHRNLRRPRRDRGSQGSRLRRCRRYDARSLLGHGSENSRRAVRSACSVSLDSASTALLAGWFEFGSCHRDSNSTGLGGQGL